MQKKRGQISLVLIVGIVIILVYFITVFLMYSQRLAQIKKIESDTFETHHSQIKKEVEECLYEKLYDSLYGLIGPQGGYVDPEYNKIYGDYDTVPFVLSSDSKIAYWYYNGIDISPSKEQVEQKIGRYIVSQVIGCFEFSKYAEMGTFVNYPLPNYEGNFFNLEKDSTKIEVSLNEEDVTVKYTFPITIKRDFYERRIDEFYTKLDVALGADFEIAKNLLSDMISNAADYNIEPECNKYSRKSYTNVFPINNRIIIYDYEPFYNKKLEKTFRLQFAYQGLNTYGYCSG
ncbi:MAG: hypothetical protein V1859_06400 [archaeon]